MPPTTPTAREKKLVGELLNRISARIYRWSNEPQEEFWPVMLEETATLLAQERERSVTLCTPSAEDIRLHAGEITPETMRTIQAVLTWVRQRMREGTDA